MYAVNGSLIMYVVVVQDTIPLKSTSAVFFAPMAMMRNATTTVRHWRRLLDPTLWEMACHWQFAKNSKLFLEDTTKGNCELARNGRLFRER
jgi:hypothetical protein